MPDLPLAGLVGLVTGATGGIGSAIARELAARGAKVGVHSTRTITNDTYETIGLGEYREHLFAVKGDVVDDASSIVAQCLDSAGRVDIVINNAGIWPTGAIVDLTDQEIAETIRVNLLGVAAITREAARKMHQGGSICNISSIEGFGAPSFHSHYVASKAGVIGYTKAAAVELGSLGIRVNAVAPGLISRPGIHDQWPEGVARWEAACPLTRLGTNVDVARAVAFLVGPDSAWISGTCLVVDGGVSARTPW